MGARHPAAASRILTAGAGGGALLGMVASMATATSAQERALELYRPEGPTRTTIVVREVLREVGGSGALPPTPAIPPSTTPDGPLPPVPESPAPPQVVVGTLPPAPTVPGRSAGASPTVPPSSPAANAATAPSATPPTAAPPSTAPPTTAPSPPTTADPPDDPPPPPRCQGTRCPA